MNENETNLSNALQDNSGGTSSIRILMLVWGLGAFAIWATVAIIAAVHGVFVMPTLPAEIVTILLGVTGIKTVQRFGEK